MNSKKLFVTLLQWLFMQLHSAGINAPSAAPPAPINRGDLRADSPIWGSGSTEKNYGNLYLKTGKLFYTRVF